MFNELYGEAVAVKAAFNPADLNTAGATGAYIDMSKGEKVAIVCVMGDSVGATAEFTLKQATDSSGTGVKDLSVANHYFKKAGAATSFTRVEPSSAAAAYDLSTDFAAQEGIVIFEINPSDLDVNNDFTHATIIVTDPAAAKVYSVCYHVLCGDKPASSVVL